jgi:methylmalonyl-CoA mutase C-terminal domain/subunit
VVTHETCSRQGSEEEAASLDSNGKVTVGEIPSGHAVDGGRTTTGHRGRRERSAPSGTTYDVGYSARMAPDTPSSRIRIVVAKPGLDGHDRGAKIVARALRDAGHEVIYTGLHQTPEQIVETAIQEDADLIGLSVLSGAHMTLFRRLLELLGERDAADIRVFGGGIIPDEDIPVLEELGVAKVFTPGATTGEITGWVEAAFA